MRWARSLTSQSVETKCQDNRPYWSPHVKEPHIRVVLLGTRSCPSSIRLAYSSSNRLSCQYFVENDDEGLQQNPNTEEAVSRKMSMADSSKFCGGYTEELLRLKNQHPLNYPSINVNELFIFHL